MHTTTYCFTPSLTVTFPLLPAVAAVAAVAVESFAAGVSLDDLALSSLEPFFG